MVEKTRTKISPPTLAKRWGIDVHKVLGWIRSGELPAINVATDKNGRPQYRIDEKDIEAFERHRNAATSKGTRAKSTRTRNRRRLIPIKQYV